MGHGAAQQVVQFQIQHTAEKGGPHTAVAVNCMYRTARCDSADYVFGRRRKHHLVMITIRQIVVTDAGQEVFLNRKGWWIFEKVPAFGCCRQNRSRPLLEEVLFGIIFGRISQIFDDSIAGMSTRGTASIVQCPCLKPRSLDPTSRTSANSRRSQSKVTCCALMRSSNPGAPSQSGLVSPRTSPS